MEELPFVAIGEDEVELTVVDLGVARAFWEGVPTGRLLARVRLHRDERDLVDVDQRASGVEIADASWDIILGRLLALAPASLERVKRAVARHARTASDEGPLAATDATIAALLHAVLSSSDADASPAEGANEALPLEEPFRAACARFDERLGHVAGDRRAAAFEACLELAKRHSAPAWPLHAMRAAVGAIAAAKESVADESGAVRPFGSLPNVLQASAANFYPWGDDGEVPPAARRACLLERPPLERVVLQGRDLSPMIARAVARYPELPIAKIAADVSTCVQKHGALLLVATREPRSVREAPRLPPHSWAPPGEIDASSSALMLASALERGAVTAPRALAILARGGDGALDAIGKEMLNVGAHPFASGVFAELLAPFARERDVVRLVTYFAIAPDPIGAARALNLCNSREVVCTVLKGWLETMLPTDGGAASPGQDPETSASARVVSCIEALRPYPALFQVVEPLLGRLSDLPQASPRPR